MRQSRESAEKSKKDDQQPYASFDCPECVQMASLMLEEELRYYMQRGHGKKSKGKSRDALFRGNNSINKVGTSAQLKGIAGLQTQGVSLKNYRLSDDPDGTAQFVAVSAAEQVFFKSGSSKRHRA